MKTDSQLSLYTASIDIIDILAGLIALRTHGSSFKSSERCLIVAILKIMESQTSNAPLFLATKYAIICDSNKDAFTKTLECLTMFSISEYLYSVIAEITHNFYAFAEVVFLSGVCILTQLFLLNLTSANIRRKTFHFFIFFIFYREHKVSISLAEGLLLLLSLFSSSMKINLLFRPFFSRNDRGKTILSHIYLLSACTYPSFYIAREEYVSTLISICFIDSIASMVGEHLKTKKKSFQGTTAGILSGILVYAGIYGKADMMLYFIVVGLVEYFTYINDNISIPFFSVLYFLGRRNLNL